MVKQKKIQPTADAVEAIPAPAIEPISVTIADVPQTKPAEVPVPAGHVLLLAVDADGNDITGSEFFYAEKTYKRFYGDESKFRLKKKTELTGNLYKSYQHENLHRASQQIIFRTTGRCGSCGR